MGEVVNLRRVRKARARNVADAQASANRAAHGRTRAEKDVAAAEAARLNTALDGAVLNDPERER